MEEKKVLTFVDMSHLNYLSRSVNQESTLRRNKNSRIQHDIPESTQIPILEDLSENESEKSNQNIESPAEAERTPTGLSLSKESSQNPEATTTICTPKTIAMEIINEMLSIVFEAEDDMTT